MLLSEEKVKCTNCGNINNVQRYDSINFSLTPEIKEKVIDETIFCMTCSKCSKTTFINYPCLLNDMANKIIIQSSVGLNTKDIADILISNFIKLGYKARIVKDNYDLCEKVRIFNSGLNDYVIEFLKFAICSQTNIKCDLDKIKFNKIDSNKKELVFNAEDNMTIAIPLEDYLDKKDNVYIMQKLDELNHQYEVSWQRLFEKYGK